MPWKILLHSDISEEKMTKQFDVISCVIHQIRLFKFLGYWKPDGKVPYKRIYKFHTFFSSSILVTFIVSQMLYLHFNRTNVEEFTSTLYVTVTFLVVLMKIGSIYKNTGRIEAYLKTLDNSPLTRVKCKRDFNLAKNTKKLSLTIFFLALYFGMQTVLFWSIIPIWQGNGYSTIAKGWFPYDWQSSRNFVFTYIFQFIATLWDTLACLNVDSFFSSLVLQIGLQCDLLCATLNNLDQFYSEDGVLYERNDDQVLTIHHHRFSEELTNNLVVCIEHHVMIVRFVKEVDDIYVLSVLSSFFGAAAILCTCLYRLSMTQIGSMEFGLLFFYLGSILLEQVEYCWFGNEVKCKSANIMDAAFNTPWVDCDSKFRKILLQFMTLTTKPLVLRAGGLIDISVTTLISIIRTSYSYFSVLKQMAD